MLEAGRGRRRPVHAARRADGRVAVLVVPARMVTVPPCPGSQAAEAVVRLGEQQLTERVGHQASRAVDVDLGARLGGPEVVRPVVRRVARAHDRRHRPVRRDPQHGVPAGVRDEQVADEVAGDAGGLVDGAGVIVPTPPPGMTTRMRSLPVPRRTRSRRDNPERLGAAELRGEWVAAVAAGARQARTTVPSPATPQIVYFSFPFASSDRVTLRIRFGVAIGDVERRAVRGQGQADRCVERRLRRVAPVGTVVLVTGAGDGRAVPWAGVEADDVVRRIGDVDAVLRHDHRLRLPQLVCPDPADVVPARVSTGLSTCPAPTRRSRASARDRSTGARRSPCPWRACSRPGTWRPT